MSWRHKRISVEENISASIYVLDLGQYSRCVADKCSRSLSGVKTKVCCISEMREDRERIIKDILE